MAIRAFVARAAECHWVHFSRKRRRLGLRWRWAIQRSPESDLTDEAFGQSAKSKCSPGARRGRSEQRPKRKTGKHCGDPYDWLLRLLPSKEPRAGFRSQCCHGQSQPTDVHRERDGELRNVPDKLLNEISSGSTHTLKGKTFFDSKRAAALANSSCRHSFWISSPSVRCTHWKGTRPFRTSRSNSACRLSRTGR